MRQCLDNYTLDLLTLNEEPLTYWETERLISSFALGLVEELLEYHEAKVQYESFSSVSLQEVVKEAGDVLAYTVLCLASFYTPYTVDYLVDAVTNSYIENTGYFHRDVLESALVLSGDYKRLFREQTPVPKVNIVTAMETVLKDLEPQSITLADIAEANLVKLRDRAKKGRLFKGRGCCVS